jgi:hypothetical protein
MVMARANVIDGKAFSEKLVQTVATEAKTIKAAIGRAASACCRSGRRRSGKRCLCAQQNRAHHNRRHAFD